MFFDNVYSLKIFSGLDRKIVDNILDNCETRNYNAGIEVIIEGENSNGECYIIKKGIASVSICGNAIVDLNVGDIFGEIALLSEEPRTATITAEKNLEVIVLKMENILEIINNDDQLNKTILHRIEENLRRRENELEKKDENGLGLDNAIF